MRGYESPCGVMRFERAALHQRGAGLRIPMRGYEGKQRDYILDNVKVTNPHAGL